ncbi:rhodanese-like domain-containing protein [Candidatus Finniella inopinata]|uniref:Sulfurtransferase n=1 Tax=Candidatus Finniella inopinata TaxID=1696036 RepID=A0A4Q7DFF4_9PROT|nr:rhodanese-like domain-containing protein [Candidatus Finniella inopinata]RZI45362.1 sulfurtransferase [Candidatus Finniella inopinata]
MIRSLTPKQLQEKITDLKNICVVDVRQDWEYKLCALPDSLHIPLMELDDRLEEIPPSHTIVVICHHGIRSQQGALQLIKAGFKEVFNLTGGIDAWGKEVDPSIGFY